MSNLPKYARELHDEIYYAILSIAGLSGEEFRCMAEEKSYKKFIENFTKTLQSKSCRSVDKIGVSKSNSNLALLYEFYKSVSFCVPKVPEDFSFKPEYLKSLPYGKSALVDFRAYGKDCVALVNRYPIPLRMRDVNFNTDCTVWVKDGKMRHYNILEYSKIQGKMAKYSPYAKLQFSDEHDQVVFGLNPYNGFLVKNINKFVPDTGDPERINGRDYHIAKMNEQLITTIYDFQLPNPSEIIDAVSYALYCYGNMPVLNRKNGRVARTYKEHKVHISNNHTGDKYVPLHTYADEYHPAIKQEWKGGHHSSPVPHDVRGYYRKSRGRGNYDLKDGKFVFVGNMKGEYSFVESFKTGKDKQEKVIYNTNSIK